MKKFLLAACAVAATAISVSASAADLKAPVYKAPVVAPVFDWSGLYVGLNGGYGWGRNYQAEAVTGAIAATTDLGGGVIGGQLGYNVQLGNNVVLGVEATFDWANIDGRSEVPYTAPGPMNFMTYLSSKITALATFDARFGYAMGNLLPYVKAGYAAARVKDEIILDLLNDPASQTEAHSHWMNGWNVGAGIEYAINRHLIIGIEYVYMDFGSLTWTAGGNLWKDDVTVSTITARVSYKF